MLFAFLGTSEVIIILAIALLVFGPAKLPEIGRQIGAAMREMRKMSNDVQRALDLDDNRYDSYSYRSETSAGALDSYNYVESPTYMADAPYTDTEDSARSENSETDGLPPPVITIEPPGPPKRQEEL